MCTVVILSRPGREWPLVLGANRDERLDRPWKAPARHWPDRPEIVAGLDESAGGSWMGLNETGVVVAILNRPGSLGPQDGKRSRGELVLEALDHADAVEAARVIRDIEPSSYRSFNMVIADNRDVFWVRHGGEDSRSPEVFDVPAGLSMLTAHDLDDPASPRVGLHLSRFQAAPQPDPAADDWFAWEALLADQRRDATGDPQSAMSILTDTGFGTSSSSLIALPAPGKGKPVWRFAAGRPGAGSWQALDLAGA